MRAASIPHRPSLGRPLSKRMLGLAGDERLVEQIRGGNEAAFEVAFERHGQGILGFCRHMLGSVEEAEDAVQHVFAAAYGDLQRHPDREILLKPWLYAIARNRCLSVLRARREQAHERVELSTAGLAEEVERRAELRQLVADLQELPEEQRAALLLAELGDMPHSEVAGVLGCEVPRVKALVFRARSALIQRREARDTPCEEIREQLANLRGGSLRRSELRLHLRECPGCQAYRHQVALQRKMLSVALPVVPGLGLKAGVLAAMGVGGGSAGGGAAAAAGLGGAGLTSAGSFATATAVKVAVVAALVGGGTVAGTATLDRQDGADGPAPASEPAHVPAPDAADARGASAERSRKPVAQGNGRDGTRTAGARARRERAKAVPPGTRSPKLGHERPAKRDKAKPAAGRDRSAGPAPPATPRLPKEKSTPAPVEGAKIRPKVRTEAIAPMLAPAATPERPTEKLKTSPTGR